MTTADPQLIGCHGLAANRPAVWRLRQRWSGRLGKRTLGPASAGAWSDWASGRLTRRHRVDL